MPLTAENVDLHEKISELEETITNLRRLEATVARNSDMFDALLGATRGGIALVSADGHIIRVVCGVLGYPLKALNGCPMADLVHREDREGLMECYGDLVRNRKRKVRGEARFRKADGSYGWFEFTVTDLLDHPSVMALVHSHYDVTWLRRGRLNAAELGALSTYAGTSVFSVDPHGEIRTWHPSAERLLGYTEREAEGLSMQSLVPPALAAEDRARRAAAVASGEPSRPLITELISRDGRAIRVELVLAPLTFHNAIQAVSYLVRRAG